MNEDILDAIKRIKLNKLDRSIRASEANEERVHKATQVVKRMLTNGELTDEFDVRTVTAQQMCQLYYTMVSDYTSQANYTDFNKISKQAIAFWARVVQACEETSLSPRLYLQAQFEWFHNAFRKVPETKQLITDTALERAKEFKGKEKKLVASSVCANIPKSDIFKRCDKQVRAMCKAQGMSRVEFYKEFVLTGEVPLPVSFLLVDPAYRSAIGE